MEDLDETSRDSSKLRTHGIPLRHNMPLCRNMPLRRDIPPHLLQPGIFGLKTQQQVGSCETIHQHSVAKEQNSP